MTQKASLETLPQTPMWAQYIPIKKEALDCLLFYRMGDFYELFLDDAIEASSILGITLTARNKGEDIPVPMCGVPYHSSGVYINRLLKAGKRVAICEQVEEASATKGIVRREIRRIVTPGMVLDPDTLDSERNNFMMVLDFSEKTTSGAFAIFDISTGLTEFSAFHSLDQLRDHLGTISPAEIVGKDSLVDSLLWNQNVQEIGKHYFPCVSRAPDFIFNAKIAFEELCQRFGVLNLDGFSLNQEHPALGVVGAGFRRIRETQKSGELKHLQPPRPLSRADFLQLDDATIEHLDLFPKPSQNPQDSVFNHLNQTVTSMGARMLRSFLDSPLKNLEQIEGRQNAVDEFYKNPSLLLRVRDHLSGIRDVERLLSKIGLKTATPRDVGALLDILGRIPHLKAVLADQAKSPLLGKINSNIDPLAELYSYLAVRLRDELPAITREGNIFKSGWNPELDELIDLTEDGKTTIQKMENRERESTGISSLKIKYNRVFGYFIEVTSTNLGSVPSHYIRKQTTANGERFLTEELKKFEDKILNAQDKRIALEESLFQEALSKLGDFSSELLLTAKNLAQLDALASFGKVAAEQNYVRPQLTEEFGLEIIEGRHPAIEQILGKSNFIGNSISFDVEHRVFLITGPNMAGKSTFMRQVAIITLLAHTGSFVPAKTARIGLVDRIATRVGASDKIGRGQSTFMVEMNEMAKILRQSSEKSLLIIDEIGRGTSTYDGLALAWAILEDLVERVKCRTLFATHYHELTSLSQKLKALKNICVSVEERDGKIVFVHRVKEGVAPGSYGIEVAKLAGLPHEIIERALRIMGELEATTSTQKRGKRVSAPSLTETQLSFFSQPPGPNSSPEIQKKLKDFEALESNLRNWDPNQTTPMEALLKLKALKDTLPPLTFTC